MHPLTTFKDLDLIEPIQRAVADEGYTTPTPIQSAAIPLLLNGRDVLASAQTGTGKTAAFTLPILQLLSNRPTQKGKRKIRALVMTPTRELAAQIGESLRDYGRFLRIRHTVIFGGVSERPQISALRSGFEVLIATPGRLLDLQGRGFVDLSNVEFFVLDEADRMLDMGFIRDVKKVLPLLPVERQNLLFSATIPPTVQTLAGEFLRNPEYVVVTPPSSTVDKIDQSVMFVEKNNKRHLLLDLLNAAEEPRAIVFTRTKHGANRLTKQLIKGGVEAVAIHGNKSQGARKRALEGFRRGDVQVLVATDIASRGIDIDDVTHVFNFDLPNEPESYVHRIGRTARAGRGGVAVSFCDPNETAYLRDIERISRQSIPQVLDHQYHCPEAVPRTSGHRPRGRGSENNQGRGRSSSPRSSSPRSGSRSSRGSDNRRGSGPRRGRGQSSNSESSNNGNGNRRGRGRGERRERDDRGERRDRDDRGQRQGGDSSSSSGQSGGSRRGRGRGERSEGGSRQRGDSQSNTPNFGSRNSGSNRNNRRRRPSSNRG